MAGASKFKTGGDIVFPAYDIDDLKRLNLFGEPHPAEAFVLLWSAIVRTDEKAASSTDLDLWVDVRRKFRPLEHTVKETVPGDRGVPVEVETIVCHPDGGTITFTARELAMVQRLWTAARAKMPLAQAERRMLVDGLVFGTKRREDPKP